MQQAKVASKVVLNCISVKQIIFTFMREARSNLIRVFGSKHKISLEIRWWTIVNPFAQFAFSLRRERDKNTGRILVSLFGVEVQAGFIPAHSSSFFVQLPARRQIGALAPFRPGTDKWLCFRTTFPRKRTLITGSWKS